MNFRKASDIEQFSHDGYYRRLVPTSDAGWVIGSERWKRIFRYPCTLFPVNS